MSYSGPIFFETEPLTVQYTRLTACPQSPLLRGTIDLRHVVLRCGKSDTFPSNNLSLEHPGLVIDGQAQTTNFWGVACSLCLPNYSLIALSQQLLRETVP